MQVKLSLKDIIEQIILAVLLFFTIFYSVWANDFGTDKVIYGDDDRVQHDQLHSSKLRILSQSTAAMVEWENLDINGDRVTLRGKTLKEDLHLCSGERFAGEINPVNCSGFLIAPNILVTAGHCMETYEDCQNYAWVFDFDSGDKKLSYKKSVFRCSAILNQIYNDDDIKFPNDFAVILLDRSTHRQIAPYRKRGRVANDAQLAVVGHPSGLPQKIGTHGTIRKNEHKDFFVTNLDTFSGNSGSPVIDLKSGLVEGVLVRGEDDYERDLKRRCFTVKRCKMDECRGEDVTRITNITYSLNKKSIFTQIQLKNPKALWRLMRHRSLRSKIDQTSGNTLLQTAIASGNKTVAKFLLKKSTIDITHDNKFATDAFNMLAKIRDPRLNSLLTPLLNNAQFNLDALKHNRFPLMVSAIYGYSAMTKQLLRANADVANTNRRGYTALIAALLNDREQVARILIPFSDLEHRDRAGWSPLLVAARYTSKNLVKVIYSQLDTSSINQQNMYGHTPLMLSILNTHSETFNYILQQPEVDLNIKRRNGQTAAHFALQNNQLDKFFKLIEKGAKTDIKDNRNFTVIDMLKRMNRIDLVDRVNQIIIKRGNSDE